MNASISSPIKIFSSVLFANGLQSVRWTMYLCSPPRCSGDKLKNPDLFTISFTLIILTFAMMFSPICELVCLCQYLTPVYVLCQYPISRQNKKNPKLASRILLWGSGLCYCVSGCVKSGLPTFADSSDARLVWYSFSSSLLLGTRSNSATNSPKIRRVAGWFFASVPSP